MTYRVWLVATFVVASSAFGQAAPTQSPALTAAAKKVLNGPLGQDVTIGLSKDAKLASVLACVDTKRLRVTDSTLVAFGTRNTFSDTMSQTHGIGAARRWIKSVFDQDNKDCGGCLKIWYDDSVQAGGRGAAAKPVNIVNVVAMLPGRDTSRVFVITGHYDSCLCSAGGTSDGTPDAPGANDDGSGTSAIMELVRLFSKNYPKGLETSVVFATVDAEEQGLWGSRQLAARLHAHGYKVVGDVTNDIVGNVTAEDGSIDSTSVRIYTPDPDNGSSRELGRYAWALGTLYNPKFTIFPDWRLDRIGRGSDHESFIDLGDPGMRVVERLENTTHQHLPADKFEYVNFGYITNVAKLDGAIVGSLAAAPAAPACLMATRIQAGAGGQAFRLTWPAVPDAVGYELLARRTISPTWELVVPVGNVTQFEFPRQADDEYWGVRAMGADGFRSLALVYPAPTPAPAAGGRQGGAGAAGGAAGAGAGRGGGGGAGAGAAAAGRGAAGVAPVGRGGAGAPTGQPADPCRRGGGGGGRRGAAVGTDTTATG